ncbi:MAG TPA: HEAT repeat domain-containing protein [bacterium]|nr:HEAT repeat domain-containing protein [bacterium]
MLDALQVRLASSTVREMRVALSNYFLYHAGNDMVIKSIERFRVSLEGLFEALPSVGIAESEGRLLVEGSPLDERMTGSTNMIKDVFLTHKVQSITFLPGLPDDEIKGLFELLKPKALPSGVSLVQAMAQKPLPHIRLNEKIYVAIQEGQKVVSGEEAPKEENLQDALEALQYFLQIFTRVKPDTNKKEVARKLMENMGGWLQDVGEPLPAKGPGPGEGGAGLLEVLNALNDVRQRLGSPGSAKAIGAVRMEMDEVLKKLVSLAERQGAGSAAQAVLAQGTAGPGEDLEIADALPPGTASLLANMQVGRWGFLSDPSQEQGVADLLTDIQDPSQEEVFEQFWERVWGLTVSGDVAVTALALRHLNRVNWLIVPRHLQLEGMRRLRQILTDRVHASTYPIALTLAQDWMPQEIEYPDWTEFLEMTRVLKEAAIRKPPLFEHQNMAARAALETIFSQPVLERFLKAHAAGDKEKVLKVLQLLGTLASDLLLERAFTAPEDSPLWMEAVELLNGMESKGAKVFEEWLEDKGGQGDLGRFLDIFKKVPMPATLADHFEKHWSSFDPEVQLKVLDLAETWKKTDLRPLLLDLLKKPEGPLSLRAVQVLGKVGLDGDSRVLMEAARRHPTPAFWTAVCQALGNLADPASLDTLLEWAASYKLLENRKNRPLEVRRAALEALGRYRSRVAKNFLEDLKKEGEKDVKQAVDQALRSVTEKLSKPEQGS